MKKNMDQGINLFAGFSAPTATQDKSLYYNPDSPYTEKDYYELKNLIEKCSKKSQNTKLKSISTITTICEGSTSFEVFIDLLPNWIFLFNRIVRYDTEKSVRDAAFKLQTLFFSKFKTKFGNFLQEIFTPIWLGRNDPCKEVSESAKKAFLTAFPPNKHVMVIEKCIERYIREILPILNKELQESEEIMERLMSSSIQGIKDALLITESIKTSCEVFLSSTPIWSFIESSHKPLVRCSALQCFNTFINLSILTQSHLSTSCPIIFSLISDKNRTVHQVLWGEVLPNFMEKFPSFPDHVNPNKILSELVACTSRGAFGAGPSFYLSLVKVVSLINKDKLKDKKSVENLLMGILKGLSSEEGSFYGKYALNAYYEVLLYLYIKVIENNSYLDLYFIHPVGLYLNCSSSINSNSYLASIPLLLAQTLGYLETKVQFPDIFQPLFQLVSGTLSEKVELAVGFLKDLSKHLESQGPQCRTLIQNLLHIIHAQMSQDIDNKVVIKDFQELSLKLPLFKTFSGITMKYSTFEPKVLDWWVRSSSQNFPEEVLLKIADVMFIHPDQWAQALKHSIKNFYQLGILIPEKPEILLDSVTKTSDFKDFVNKLFEYLDTSDNLADIGKISSCLKKIFSNDMLSDQGVVEFPYRIIQRIIQDDPTGNQKTQQTQNLNFSKAFELFLIISKKIDEDCIILLSDFLIEHGWKLKTNELWEICKGLNPSIQDIFVEKSQKALLENLKSTNNWNNHINISKKLLKIATNKANLAKVLLVPELFTDFYFNINSWILFDSLVSETDASEILSNNIWLLSKIIGYNIVPSLNDNFSLHHSYQKYTISICNPLILSQTISHNITFIENLLLNLMEISQQYPAYRFVLIQYLKICLYNNESPIWDQDETMRLFSFCMSHIKEDTNYTLIICDIIYIFKSILSKELYNVTLEKWRKLAYEAENEVSVRIYAACIPEDDLESLEEDRKCLNRIISRGLRPTDLALALSIFRRGGFESLDQPDTIELLASSMLLQGKDLHEVLPYVQRLLSKPSNIFNKEQISELLIHIPLHTQSLTQPEILEISETFTRMYSIIDENIDEESLYKILSEINQINLSKSVYSLLEYVYSQCVVTRPKLQPIPEYAEKLLYYVPNVKTDLMETKTLAYVLCWMLCIEKYRMERFHMEKNKEGTSDFMACFKDLLEKNTELVTVFLTTLMGYLHDESELDINYNVAWTDIFNEDSIGKLACIAMYKFLSTFPSLGRNWWLGTERFLSNSVQKTVKKLISFTILIQEIRNIENRQIEWKEQGISIVCSKASRDITCVFTKSEFSVQVVLQIPNDFPLSPPDPVVTKKVKISEDKVRKWQLSIVQLLQQENSSLLEVLLAWKQHVERELEGIEDCYICYYLVHPTDKSLPNLPCQVCSNKFHKLCIQKWFASSHNTTCPLCRNPFRS